MKKPIKLFFVCMIVFSLGMVAVTKACEEECPPCQVWNGSACVNDCESGEICCNDVCMTCSGVCCDDACCESGKCCGNKCCESSSFTCCGENKCCADKCCSDNGNYCCGLHDTCCVGACCPPDQTCEYGQCTKPCKDDGDCAICQKCKNGKCEAKCVGGQDCCISDDGLSANCCDGGCCGDTCCRNGQPCVEGKCGCNDNDDCYANDCKHCENGKCESFCEGGESCCDGDCCTEDCCNQKCCGSTGGVDCCGGTCCDEPCCGDICCEPGQCCKSEQCGTHCDADCCIIGSEFCCNDDTCCSNDQACCGKPVDCYDPTANKCCEDSGENDAYTCPTADPSSIDCCDHGCCDTTTHNCCDDIGGDDDGYCCDSDQSCCYGDCCESGYKCCDDLMPESHYCCEDDQECCSGNCCESDECCIYGECVVVSAIQIDTGTWQNVTGNTICVLKGTKYTFKAILTPEVNPWPGYQFAWSGAATGFDQTIDVTFDSEGTSTLTATLCGKSSKSVTIDVIVPSIDSMEFTSATGVSHYQIYDNTGLPIYCGWKANPPMNNPGCFKQGEKSAVKVQFNHAKDITYSTGVVVKGNVNSSDEYIVGGDYAETNITFGVSWPSPSSANTVLSTTTVDKKIDYDNDTDISWYYKVPSGTNEWIEVGDTDNLVYYRIYDSSKTGTVSGTLGGNFQNKHFTVTHIAYATDIAEGASADVTESSIAEEIIDERGSISVKSHGVPHSNVDTMWSYFETGTNGQCGCFASGMAYVLRCLGVHSNVAYANLDAAINSSCAVSGVAYCPLCDPYPPSAPYRYYGMRWGAPNNWQGCCYITASGASTVCYDPQHELVEYYWELGNDEDGGTSGDGLLYDYEWRSGNLTGQVQTGTTTGACGHTLTMIKTPNYSGN